MTEELINECEFYLPLSENCNEILDDNGNEIYKCSSRQDCYYKQLKRLEQENKELREWLDRAESGERNEIDINNTYRSVLEEIKEVLKFYADSWIDEKIYPNLHYDNTKAKEGLSKINEVLK